MRRTPILLAAFAVTLLVVLNPDMDEFQAFAETEVERLVQREAGEAGLGRVLGELSAGLSGPLVRRLTERNDYILFSTYTLDLDGPDEEGNEWRFLGLGGFFLELERPESLKES